MVMQSRQVGSYTTGTGQNAQVYQGKVLPYIPQDAQGNYGAAKFLADAAPPNPNDPWYDPGLAAQGLKVDPYTGKVVPFATGGAAGGETNAGVPGATLGTDAQTSRGATSAGTGAALPAGAAAPSGAGSSSAAPTLAAAAGGSYGSASTGYGSAPIPTTSFTGGFMAPRSVAQDQQNTNSLLSSAVQGSGIQGTDGKIYSPADVMANLASQGNPLGTAWVNANNGYREDKIGAAGADSQAAYKQQAADFASGKAAGQAMQAGQSAYNALGSSGNAGLQAAGQGISDVRATAQGMDQDIAGLRAAASGTVPSAAQIQQQQGISSAINSQASLAASARGGNMASAMRTAAGAGVGMQAQGVANNAALRANEMATARGQLTQATANQGSLYNAAGTLGNTSAQTAITRDNAQAAGLTGIGNTTLNAQQVGMGATGNAYEQDQARTMNQVATDQDEQRQLQNYMLQLFNTTNGNAAQIDNSQRAAAVQTRGQDLQLAAGIASGVGATAAGLFGAK